jgi:hypothetical protein
VAKPDAKPPAENISPDVSASDVVACNRSIRSGTDYTKMNLQDAGGTPSRTVNHTSG